MPEAREEHCSLPSAERAAMLSALRKLEAGGTALGAPHTSKVKGSTFRELRPRRGRSPWRALYRQVGTMLVVAAVAPEALADRAEVRLAMLQGEEEKT